MNFKGAKLARGISEEFLEELKQRNNIVTVVSKYVPLERKGRNWWGRCPFHLEKTPSFSVNEVDQYYHCFGCKASGNVVKFVMEIESLTFIEAVKMLAENSGLTLPTNDEYDEDYKKQKEEKAKMLACTKEAAKRYHDNLLKSSVAKAYLKERGITDEMVTRFGIGYANGYTDIITHLESKGFSRDIQYRVGLIKEKDGRFYDAIGDRIAFPIINIYGEVVGFSGRTLKKQVDYAKYINTGDTPIFLKSKNLFGINLVKKFKQSGRLNEIIIVEGQTDVIALHKAGYCGTVASLGTALTIDQARLIKRLCDDVIICYDGDTAGTKATLRGLDILKHEGLNVRVASLPDGMDPDEVIRKHSTNAFDKIIQDALPLIEYKLKQLKLKHNMQEFDGKAKYVDEAIDVLLGTDEVEAEVYLTLISDTAGVYKDFLRSKLKNRNLKLSENNTIQNIVVANREEKKDDNLTKAKVCILANMLRKHDYTTNLEKYVQLFDSDTQEIAQFLVTSASVQEFINKFENTNSELVGEIVNYNFTEDNQVNKQLFEDCLWIVYKNNLQAQQTKLTQQLTTATGEERVSLMKQLMKISQQINSRRVDL